MQITDLMVYIISYAIVFVLSWISKTNKNYRLFNDEGEITRRRGNMLAIHLAGIMWLGLVPVILLKLTIADILLGNIPPGTASVFSFGLLFLLAIILALRLGKNISTPSKVSDEMFIQLSQFFFTRYFIIRALYLCVFELWFRGFLLFESIKWIGIPAALSLNIFLYTLLQVFKSKKEILSCIPFGFLLCFLCIFFKAAWPSIILHTGFALAYELNIYRKYINSSNFKRT